MATYSGRHDRSYDLGLLNRISSDDGVIFADHRAVYVEKYIALIAR